MREETTGATRASPDGDSALRVAVESPLPSRLGAGLGNALFVCGSCYHPTQEIRSLTLRLGSVSTPAIAFGMPRPDLRDSTGISTAYRSGFWAIVAVPRCERAESAELSVEVTLDDRLRAHGAAGWITLEPARVPDRREAAISERVAICMATYEPELDLFERQIESIREQTHRDWICVISDDGSAPARFEAIRATIGADPRFELIRNERRQGFYANFERALSLADPQAEFIALADQDDVWCPDKIETLLAEIGEAPLAYSDAQVVERDGTVRSETYWSERPNNRGELSSLMLANSIPGSAAIYRRQVLRRALPFPPDYGRLFHDHWLAVVALTLGPLRYVDRPLYEYVQHAHAVLGHEGARPHRRPSRSLRQKLAIARRDPEFYYRHWRTAYFHECCRAALFAHVLLVRFDQNLTPARRRALERLTVADRSALALGWIAGRRLRRWLGSDETLGAEGRLLRAVLWRHLLGRFSRRRLRHPAWAPSQAAFVLPPDPGHRSTPLPAPPSADAVPPPGTG